MELATVFFLSKLQNTLPKYAATLSTNSSYDFQVPWGTIRQKKRWNKLQLQYVFGVSNPFALRCLCGNPIQQKQAPQQDGDPAPPPSLPVINYTLLVNSGKFWDEHPTETHKFWASCCLCPFKSDGKVLQVSPGRRNNLDDPTPMQRSTQCHPSQERRSYYKGY